MNRPENLATLAVVVQGSKDGHLLKQLLEWAGHVVVQPSLEAPDLHADLLIVDEHFGDVARERLREWQRRQSPIQLPVLVLLPPGADAHRWLRSGCDDVLRIPIAKEEFLARIDAFVRIRRASERAEAESERRFRATFQHAPLGIVHCAADGTILRINPRACRLLGVDAESITSTSLEALLGCDFAEPDSAGGNGPQSLRERPIAYRRRDGAQAWVLASDWRIEDSTRPALRRIVIMKDVTLVKEAEARMANLNAELEEKVGERTAQLKALNAELDSFTSSVSHDLRAPVRIIEGFTELLVEELGPKMEGRVAHLLLRLRGASTRMGSMIDGLLALAQSSRAPMQLARVDLGAFAREIIDELAAESKTRTVHARVGEDLFAQGDPRLLRLLLQNLLGNAWKYTAHTLEPEIVFNRSAANGEFFVSDNGAGFDGDRADQLFKPFQRLHNESEFPGAGVGLATVHRIVTRHGGTIRGEGSLNKGATFTFTLPG